MDDQFGYQNSYMPTEPAAPQPTGHAQGYATAALVLGIASLVLTCCCWCFALFYAGGPCAVLAIVFACLSKRDNGGKLQGKALAGLILGIIGIIFFLICLVLYISLNSVFSDPEALRAYLERLEQYYKDRGIDMDFGPIYEQLE